MSLDTPVTPGRPAEDAPSVEHPPQDLEPDSVDSLFPDAAKFRNSHKCNFIFGHVNINSFRHKYPFVNDMLNKHYFDYFAVSESKLDHSFPDAQFLSEGYVVHRQDKTSTSGGLLVYIRSDLPHRRVSECEINENGIESLCIELTVGKVKSVIACIYKNPAMKHDVFKRDVTLISDKILRICSDFILIGDMNSCPVKNNTISEICELFGLNNLIKGPTCHKGPTPTLLDVILVSNPRRYAGALNCECALSDFHNIVAAATRRFAPSQTPRQILYRSYKHFDNQKFISDIVHAPFHVGNIFDDVDDLAWYTSALLSDIIDSHAPVKTKTIQSDSVPYMNSQLRKALYSRNMARNKFRTFGNSFWEENRRQRNRVVSIRKKSLSAYFAKHCASKNKSFWSTVKPFMTNKNSKKNCNIILSEADQMVVDNEKVADIFNKHFSTIASTIGFPDRIDTTNSAIDKHRNHASVVKIKGKFSDRIDSFCFTTVSHDMINRKLRNINGRKATGYDNIPGKLLRLAHSELAFPLTNLINTCLTRNTFPDIMKYAELSPIFKQGDNLSKGNYRPVSVLTAVSKLYESVINDQMYKYFCDIFNDFLCAFRNGYSCQSLLLRVIDDWKKSLDKKEIVGAIFMDLSKAFDCLSHSLLISKLNAYGLSVPACDLISSYLSGRKQRVKIGNSRSDWVELEKGVPQGSVLGPLLFNIFINDLFMFIEKCLLYNYADDNSMSKASQNLHEVLDCLQHDSDIAIEWFSENGMQANPGKFQFMIMSPANLPAQTIVLNNNNTIMSENFVKVLGVIIDDKLTFSRHVSMCCTKAAKQLNAMARISRYIDIDARKLIYNSFIVSCFSYCPLVWHFCGKQNSDKLEKINERALRILYNDFTSSYDQLLSQHNTTTILISRLKIMTLEVFKCLKTLGPPCLHDLFTVKPLEYNMRNPTKVIQPTRRCTTYGLRSISYVGAKLWNALPHDSADILNMELGEFKSFLDEIGGPICDNTFSAYV